MNGFKKLVVEAHRRSLWQVLGIYLFGSWLGYQVVNELTDGLGLPEWVPGFAVVLFIIGLPIVLATAFIQEGAPIISRAAPPWAPSDPTLLPSDDDVDARITAADATPRRGKDHFFFTWQKAVLGGVVAFLLLGATVGSYMGLRNAGVGPFASLLTSGALDNRERILIAEFDPTTGDSALANAVTQAFRVDFAQTPVVTVVAPAYVREVLQRMSRDPKSPLDADLAREVAVRDNIKAYITGELANTGGRYVVAAQLVSAKDANILASFRETASDSTEIVATVDKLSKKLRAKIGESLKTIRREKPLESVSTPSLDALLKYTKAVSALDTDGDFETGISLLQEAISIDSTFAMAWRKLSVAYFNGGYSGEKQIDAARKAYEYRDRLTDTERYAAEGYYHYSITQDWNKAINAYQLMIERDLTASPNNLGLAYRNVREHRKSADAFQESIRRDSTIGVSYTGLITAYIDLNELDNAEKVLEVYARRFPDNPAVNRARAQIMYARGDHAGVQTEIERTADMRRTSPVYRARVNADLAFLAQLHGQLGKSEEYRARAASANVERGNTAAPLNTALNKVAADRLVRRDPVRARARLDAALAEFPIDSIARANRPYLNLAINFAWLNDVPKAREWLARYEREMPAEYRRDDRWQRFLLQGHIAIAEKRYVDAIEAFRRAEDLIPCVICLDNDVSYAFEVAGMPDSARARYEHFVNTPSAAHLTEDHLDLANAYERLAESYEQKGDREKAALYAGKFVELWKNADVELQARVQSKRVMLQRLRGRT
jgi:eukaryotic-like serine/threonine-protein kinase